MAKFYTNSKKTPAPKGKADKGCIECYEGYAAQRVVSSVHHSQIQKLSNAFKKKVLAPLKRTAPHVRMGEHFVVPVSELKEMLKSTPKAEFVHVVNGLRAGKDVSGKKIVYPVSILAPVAKTKTDGKQSYDRSKHKKAVFLEAYPCPPDPRCPS